MYSVIMSTYNERACELSAAIDSVLNQSFTDYEFIIVCDNPNNNELQGILSAYESKDNRVKIIYNKENMGLALSLNVAIQASKGEYLIRMDADDICKPDRFQKQVDIMQTGKYDLIWSSYDYIDENGCLLEKKAEYIPDSLIQKLLPIENIIHHPTVVMKRQAFMDAGMYRNFPCAQDYDLWLRMLDNGCRMHMMVESLLFYRVRTSSITNKKKYQQLCTLAYIRYITSVREKTGKDKYSFDGYLAYMKKMGVGEKEIEQRFHNAQKYVEEGKQLIRDNKLLPGCIRILKGFFQSKFYRKQSLLIVKRKMVKN